MKIFLLAGKACSGKSEIGKSIRSIYNKKGQKTVITQYSKYIKMYAKEMTEWNGQNENKPRKFLQEFGSYIRKNMGHPTFLIDRMLQDIQIYEKFFDNVVITDVRFPNEMESIKKEYPNVYSLYVINEHGNYNLTKEESEHETEHALDDYHEFDYIIVNDDRNLLEQKLQEIINQIEEGK